MDIQPQNQQPISDDQELAKVLAGVTQQADSNAATAPASVADLPTPLIGDDSDDAAAPAAEPAAAPADEPAPAEPAAEPAAPVIPEQSSAVPSGDSSLDAIKQQALGELRPLVDKLNVSPEEKFDTYLLLLRSTDDTSLIAPAHEAAAAITDEARRAQALLDVIKEIDFLSQPQQ